MGKDLSDAAVSPLDRARYRQKVRRCLDVLALMLDDCVFDADSRTTGLEIELNLMDADAEPAMRNAEILANLADPSFQTELGQFNLELNAHPRSLCGDGFADYENDILDSLGRAEDRAGKADCTIVLIGSLPTLTPDHLVLDNISANERYRALNDQLVGARGERFSVDIRGVERLQTANDSIATEAACTSAQFHMQVPPDRFAAHWNASQALAGVQVAIGANSPYLHARRLWAETRIALFEQATDTRPDELKAQGVRPRVWFGERWITSIFDLFEENVRYFPALLPVCEDEDPVETLTRGDIPELPELRLHNGTIYRWNRPIYDVVRGRPHLRVENRILPAGPTVVDILANAAFYYGLVQVLTEEDRPLWTQMSFSAAEENFHVGAREGIDARVYWPGVGEVPVAELVLRRLLPAAYEGLDRLGIEPGERDRLLGIIERRCVTQRNGASWQADVFHRLYDDRGLEREEALREMTLRYRELMHANEPVHDWPTE